MYLQFAQLMRQAGTMLLDRSSFTVFEKEGHANYVTERDKEVQSFLMEGLAKILPEATFFAEEKENAALGSEPTFLIDPIDGTLNFMHGREASAISVALLENSQPIWGGIYQPYTGRLFHARRGDGAFCNDTPIHTANNPFHKGVTAFGTAPYNTELHPTTLRAAGLFLAETADLRRTGSAALDLCDVACGRSDVYWELMLSPWDYGAGALILTESGGMVSRADGSPLSFECPGTVLAASPACYEKALSLLRKSFALPQ